MKFYEYNPLSGESVEALDTDYVNKQIEENNTQLKNIATGKVDKVDGKGLSTNDYTNEEKEKLASLSEVGNGVTQEQLDSAIESYFTKNPISGGLTSTAKNLLVAILQSALYPAEQKDSVLANISTLQEELKKTASTGGGSSGGDSGDTTTTTYNITNTLTNCVNSNIATTIEENSSYSATLTASEGYVLGTITVKMGGVDISSSAVSGSNITIDTVTGDIEIICTAKEKFNYLNYLKATGYVVSSKSSQYSVMRFSTESNTNVYSFPVSAKTYKIKFTGSSSSKTYYAVNGGSLNAMTNESLANPASDITVKDGVPQEYKGTITPTTSYEVSSGVSNGDGTYTFTVTVTFASAGYCVFSTKNGISLDLEEVA